MRASAGRSRRSFRVASPSEAVHAPAPLRETGEELGSDQDREQGRGRGAPAARRQEAPLARRQTSTVNSTATMPTYFDPIARPALPSAMVT